MRVIIVDDEPFWRESIAKLVGRHAPYEVAATCGSLSEALDAIRAHAFELMIVDLGLPDGSGVEAIRAARREREAADILVATVFADESSVVAAICAGATGYLVKESTEEQWLTAIEDLRAGRSPISPQIARHILRAVQRPVRARRLSPDPPPAGDLEREATSAAAQKLSARELEVLNLVAKGFTLIEVGQLLDVAPDTARTHAKNIYRKLEVNSRGEAVFEATRLGLL